MDNAAADEPFPGLTDIHAHPAMNAYLWGRKLRRHYMSGHTFNPLASLTDFKMLEKGNVRVLWSSLHIPEPDYFRCGLIRLIAHCTPGGRKLLKLSPWECLLQMMGNVEEQVSATERFEIARSNAELDRALERRQTAIVHTVEGGHVLGADLEADDLAGRMTRLETLADRGVASLTVAHLFPNELAGHVNAIPDKPKLPTCHLDPKVDPGRGLTTVGEAVVERMVELRMIPDVSHCTPIARRRIYELVDNRVPVIASHVGVHSMNPVPYNLEEGDAMAIAASGGVAGVIFMPYWLESSHPGPGLESIWRTMKTLNDWSGGAWKHVAIGTDFDGFTDPPDDCDSEAKLPAIREKLEAEGLSRPEAEAVVGTNAREVLRRAWR